MSGFQKCRVVGKGVSPASYHRPSVERGNPKLKVSPSMLKNFWHCPSRFFNGYVSPESASKDFGNLLDTLLLTPEHFDARYILQPENYETTGMKCPSCGTITDSKKCRDCKCDRVETPVQKPWTNQSTTCADWTATQAKAGRDVVSQDFMNTAWAAAKRIQKDEILASFIAASNTQVLVEGEWLDEATGQILPVRCLLDLAPRLETEFANCLGDLKTTRSASVMAFQRDCFKLGYHLQAAFDLDLYNAATGERRSTWCFAVVENYPPFEFGRRMMRDVEPGEQPESGNLINLGRVQYKKAIANYAACLATGKWPSYDDTDESSGGWTPLAATPWQENEVMFAPKFVTAPESAVKIISGVDYLAGA